MKYGAWPGSVRVYTCDETWGPKLYDPGSGREARQCMQREFVLEQSG